MRLVRYRNNGRTSLGFLYPDGIVNLNAAVQLFVLLGETSNQIFQTALHLDRIQPSSYSLAYLRDPDAWTALGHIYDFVAEHGDAAFDFLPRDEVEFLPPLPRPGKIVCVGMNYPSLDPNWQPPSYPVLFHKVATSLVGHGSAIILPSISKKVLYEGELALVIGPDGQSVAAYTIANDVGANDIEARTSQWAAGKMFATFCPLGPVLVTVDEIADPNQLSLVTTLNGQEVQASNTTEMVFGVDQLVAYIADLTTLEAGDLILTGSPRRVGPEPDPRIPMQPGDTVSVQIEGLGALTNPVLAQEQ
jgi:2-keto-4-pentenoate hydratase/2-oxohepta-3-ene-1,7-dioic acid hydratase in catechol pathway